MDDLTGSRGQKSNTGLTGRKSRYGKVSFLSGGFFPKGKNLLGCLFLVEAPCIPCLMVPFFIFKAIMAGGIFLILYHSDTDTFASSSMF